jgi:hypothetical protein
LFGEARHAGVLVESPAGGGNEIRPHEVQLEQAEDRAEVAE